ncbi:MAG: Tol-Pal system beta propeller repeat protein TolB [Gammaproteobacteria bacterium RIFCSPHIGHO2_12_FULL_42_10]|nr:MAG: Tol-Pal system beta propeller repeat protein TolB [Gammaproteobacteria bacterium RIFCSPHIGHO2_12_FULL_42_10]
MGLMMSYSANAMLNMELNRGVLGAIPVSVSPFEGNEVAPQSIATIVSNDLQNSGRIKLSKQEADYVVVGKVTPAGADRYQVSFSLKDGMSHAQGRTSLVSKKYTVSSQELRTVSHHISDLVYQTITGTRGVFSTKIAYVVVGYDETGHKRYTLEVADQDGYGPHTLLRSPEPIMSPSWAPNGRQIAYVSFEHHAAGIYIQNVITGERTLVSHMQGINGAPAFSPDGRRLALVLSTNGTPNIYVMDIASHHLTEMTHDFYINTEPAWSPNGRSLLFTSNRSGGPQIYQLNLQTRAVSRMTYDGNYNARASYTPDGNHIAMIHSVSGVYSIGILDLDSGTMRVLSGRSNDSASPSMAPNGSMVLYDTAMGSRNVLGMVSVDGRVQLTIPARNGDAQDPAWSPYLS